MNTDYRSPVNKLLTYGDCHNFKGWPNYLDLGLTEEHIPELIRMATDEELNWADSDSLEVWAPIHAWRTLGQLKAEEAIEPLMNLFHELEDNDWAGDELPEVYGMVGPKAIPALAEYLANTSHDIFPRISASHSLECIGNHYPEVRDECISALTNQLERFTENDPLFNGFLISYLVDLKAVESLPIIREAFEEECVDYTVMGDLEEVEIELGLRKKRSTPPNYPTFADKHPELKQIASLLKQAAAAEMGKTSSGAEQKNPPKKRKLWTSIGRNDPCPCGSGKKYKKCCRNKPKKQDIVLPPFPPVFSTQPIELSVSEQQEIERLLRQDRLIPAIKRVRELTGAGLKDAKDYVDRLRQKRRLN